ncbi:MULTISPECIES: hypothetical protein [Streptomyces]|uniref:Uncharacterized protein n=1 Tax=Streptomyces cadmiisoli TaxID=2184053 RepID=A0A2Z4IV30_9ACTN|nr:MULTISPECIES: hypothetical protein [Streptomyces]AWW36426.1 hypothetical protein DN051_07050 [Streptomyces cadmiisoli]KOV52732.1 hypothetical protein ADL00_36625 [Streptomyces sp. AS58]
MSDTSPPPPPPRPPRSRRTMADQRDLSRLVLFYALAVGALLIGVAALLVGLAWSDLAGSAYDGF